MRRWRLPLATGIAVLLIGVALVLALVPSGAEQTLAAARLQTALCMVWHIAIACFGTGFPLLMLLADGHARRAAAKNNGRAAGWDSQAAIERLYQSGAVQLARLWDHAFAVLFAAGAVSGTVLSFTLGMLWPGLFAKFGDLFGVPFTFESLAFFSEAIALGFWMYGRGKISPAAHRAAGIALAISGVCSAVFVVCANGWMNTPGGFRLEAGVLQDVNLSEVMFNAAALPEAVHMVLAALLVTGWVVAAAHALALLRRPQSALHRQGMLIALGFAALLTPVQLLAGDMLTRFIATNEPAKFAAAEALLHSGPNAPLAIGGVVIDGELRGAIEIPSGLSLLLHGDSSEPVAGLDSIPVDQQPAVGPVHLAFQVMVACGAVLLLAAALHGWVRWRGHLHQRRMLQLVVVCGVLAVLAMEAGWMVTELGRQPWVVRGYLRTSEAVTTQQGLLPGLLVVIVVFAALSAALVHALRSVVADAEKPQ